MAYNALSTLTKSTIAVAVAGGIAISGITWQGDGDITNIKGNLDSLKNKLTQSIDDNAWLKEQFDSLKGKYSTSVSDANSKINALVTERDTLNGQITDLKAQLEEANANADMTDEKTELQNEINRLEGELDKANKEIADLQQYAKEADESTSYTAVDRTQYATPTETVQDVPASDTATATPAPTETGSTTETAPTTTEPATATPAPSYFVPITDQALTLDKTNAEKFASESNVTAINNGIKALAGVGHITGVTTYNNKLAYTVSSDWRFTSSSTPNGIQALKTATGYASIQFVYENGNPAKAF